MIDENRTASIRRVAATLAASAVGIAVHTVHVVAGIGLLSLAREHPRDPALIGFALMQLVIAVAAVPAAIELARLQRLWLSAGLRLRRTRRLAFAVAWVGPLVVGVMFPSCNEHPATGAAFTQFVGLLLSTTLIELHRVARHEAHLPSPGRTLVRLLTELQRTNR